MRSNDGTGRLARAMRGGRERSMSSAGLALVLALHGCGSPEPCPPGSRPDRSEDRCASLELADGGPAADARVQLGDAGAATDAGIVTLADGAVVVIPFSDGGRDGSAPAGDAGAVTGLSVVPPVFWEVNGFRVSDISQGSNGELWAVSDIQLELGNSLHRWNGLEWEWDDASLGGARVAVDNVGVPWVLEEGGRITRRTASGFGSASWVPLAGCAKDIGIGANGAVWIVGCEPTSGGFKLSEWRARAWKAVDFGALRVSVGPDGQPWVVNDRNEIHRREISGASTTWTQLPGAALDIAIDPSGRAYTVGTDERYDSFSLYGLDQVGGSWVALDGVGICIAAGLTGAWSASRDGTLFHGVDYIPSSVVVNAATASIL